MEIAWINFVVLSILLLSLLQRPAFAIKKSYVIYLGGHTHGPEPSSIDLDQVTDSHYNFLGSFLKSKEKAKDAIFYSYRRHINGFAANLEDEEAEEISKHPDVISVFLNKGKKLHTTHSWDFLGLEKAGEIPSKSIWAQARFGEDVIIGNLDSGVWPESESFNDEGMGPVPSRWKGFCQNNTRVGVRCNRKLIGARYFNKGYEAEGGPPLEESHSTARDRDGHGTHTLSTAGGRFVTGASIFGFGNGTAKGGSPNARVAAYKVCWPVSDEDTQCADADVMAAFEAAIHDGVDVLSVSLGEKAENYLSDPIAIGSFHAVKNGIIVVCSAGNNGPFPGSVNNVAPWILTVGASSIDREFSTYVELGNKMRLKGQNLSPDTLPAEKLYPLVTSVDAKSANALNELEARFCFVGSLDPEKVKGKIVTCLQGVNHKVAMGKVVADAGGVGMILINNLEESYNIVPDPHVLPTSHVSAADGLSIFAYINSTESPMAYITPTRTQLNTKPAPSIPSFSSLGPNSVTPEILKPDIVAPGVSVIAAFTQALGPSSLKFDSRRVLFNSLSGTSMACPHISGIVGLLKTLHPDWSPAAIKSALMTTARTRSNKKEPISTMSHVKGTPFSYGAGHVRPNRAMDPGLVYDSTIHNYLNFLCASGYDKASVAKFVDQSYNCPKGANLMNFNYPSITVPHLNGSVTVTRTVKNVGSPGTYNVHIREPAGISVTVEPKSLKFKKIGEEKKFKVSLKVKKGRETDGSDYVFGKLLWSDGVHHVRSPIVVSTAKQ